MSRWLSSLELIKLRNEIVLCSLYYADYTNTLGIDKHKVCNFFDAYVDYLGELMYEDGIAGCDFFKRLEEYDNSSNLIRYYNLYENNPLAKEREKENE